MPNFLVTFPGAPNPDTGGKGRSFIIEDVFNEADAINVAFERAGLNGKGDAYYRVETQPITSLEPPALPSSVHP
jgi:hypothetical protein